MEFKINLKYYKNIYKIPYVQIWKTFVLGVSLQSNVSYQKTPLNRPCNL